MNTWIKNKMAALGSRMVFRLWATMMVLVLFGIGFMWVVQIFLFDQNYAEASLSDALNRLEPVMERIADGDIGDDEFLLPYISHMSSETFLVSEDGKFLQMYSSGHSVAMDDLRDSRKILEAIRSRDEYQDLLNGIPYRRIDRGRGRILGFEIGLPVTYHGQQAYIIIHNLLMTKTVLDLNRRQLIFLSILLTVTASVLAAVLSRQFTRPICLIRDSVDRLTHNDFTASPNLTRTDELGQLSRSVDELGKALKRVDVLRKDVIANVSHELRSPLALITGYAEMVRDITWKDEEKRTEDLNLIISESNRMSEMVTDILDYSQFQAGYVKLKKSWYNLKDIIESEIAHCRPEAAKLRIQIRLDTDLEDVQIRLDAIKISQVVRNLLNNAVNHTAEGGLVAVRIEQTAGDNQKAGPDAGTGLSYQVSVSNPGPPIPEEDRAIIWERYQRSQHQSGRRMGTGIGLSIVSTILKAHGMSYGVDSGGGWNTFWFQCP